MNEMIGRVMAAISAETHIWQRVDKTKPLPFQVIDRTEDPIVLSSWATASAADVAWHQADGEMRARAAIEAMREPTEAMVKAYDGALRTLIESVPEAERKWKTRRVGPANRDRGYKIPPSEKARCRWQTMIDAAANF